MTGHLSPHDRPGSTPVLDDVIKAPPSLPPFGGEDAPYVSVVVPLLNEEPSLIELHHRIVAALATDGITFEIVFVDDGSTDGSLTTLRNLARIDSRVKVIALRRNFGKAAALAAGFDESRGMHIVSMDADLQDDPREIPRMLDLLVQGFDVVSGWKSERHDPWTRLAASRVFNSVTRRLSHVALHDFNCGLKAYTAECVADISGDCYGELHRYLPVLAHWRGYRVTEVPVTHHPRVHGRSKYGLERYVRGALDLITALWLSRYLRRPMHVFGGIGLLCMVPGLVGLAFLGFTWTFLHHSIGTRPLLLVSSVLVLAGLQLILNGLIAEVLCSSRARRTPIVPQEKLAIITAIDPSAEATSVPHLYAVEPSPSG